MCADVVGMEIFMNRTINVMLPLLVVGLVACGGAGDTEPAQGPGSTHEQTTIRFSMWDTVDESASFIQAFHAANPDIRVEIVSIPEDYSAVINTMVIGGTAPDVILAWEVDMPRFASNGQIIPLDNLVANSDLVDVHDFIPAVAALTELTEGLYGIPWVYASHFLYFNVDMFDAAGIPHPTNHWTWEDMAEAARALTIREGNTTTQWGLTAIDFPGIWYSMIGQAGDSIIDAELNLSLGEGLRRALSFQYDLTHVYQVSPQPGGGVLDLFMAEQAAMTRQGNWFVAGYADVPFNWDVVPLPRDAWPHSSLHTGFFTISSQSQNQEAAWRFVEWMMSHPGQVALSTFTANPSAIMSVAAEGHHFVPGINGPHNWEAFDYFRYGQFTYTLINAAVTGGLINQFDAVLLGINSIDEVLNIHVPAAQATLDQLN